MTDTTIDPVEQNTDLDSLGPVDYLIVEFPAGASNFTGEMAKELLALVDAGTIRVIDVLILTKNEDGTVDAMELSDIEELGPLREVEAQLAELLAAEDVENLAAAMDPGSTAGVLIWENLWAAPFASAARRSGGQLIANGRIPIQAIIASIEADEVNAIGRRLKCRLDQDVSEELASSATRWQRQRSWPRRSLPAPRRLRRPLSLLRPSHPEGRGVAGESSRLIASTEANKRKGGTS